MRYESDAIVAMKDGRITHFGPATQVRNALPPGTTVKDLGKDTLTMAGFIDCHVHYPQMQVIGAYAGQLMDWLDKHTFVAEQEFADKEHAREVARAFLKESLRAGTTTAAVYCTVHPQSVDAFFEESEALGTRMIAGKVLMDRNAPGALRDTARQGYDESKALIGRWHGKGRQLYAVTPRFAPTSTPEQMEMAGALWNEHSGTYLQSHIAETRGEADWVKALFPDRRGYLDVYDHYGQLGKRAIYGHGIWLTEDERRRCHDTGSAIAHCPTSNLFLGSGCFDIRNAKKPERPIRVGLATDLGAGTSFSMLQTLNEAYKVAQLNGNPLSSGHAFYLATRGSARGALSRALDRQHRARHGGRFGRPRSQVDAGHRLPHALLQGPRGSAVRPDDDGRRPRGARDVCRRPARIQPPCAALRMRRDVRRRPALP